MALPAETPKRFSAKVRTSFWFNDNGEEAARFYVSLLSGSVIENRVCPDLSGALRLARGPLRCLVADRA